MCHIFYFSDSRSLDAMHNQPHLGGEDAPVPTVRPGGYVIGRGRRCGAPLEQILQRHAGRSCKNIQGRGN